MTSVESVTLEVTDPPAAHRFYNAAFGLGPQLGLRASGARVSRAAQHDGTTHRSGIEKRWSPGRG